MNIRNRIAATFAFVALTIGLFSSSPSVWAGKDCLPVKGNESVVDNGNGTTSGAIKQGGRLDGFTQTVFTSGLIPTSDPTSFSFTDDLTVTTDKGTLQTHNVTLFDGASWAFSAIARIDPNASTGDFAGVTGVLYINGNTTDNGVTYQAEITGEICFTD